MFFFSWKISTLAIYDTCLPKNKKLTFGVKQVGEVDFHTLTIFNLKTYFIPPCFGFLVDYMSPIC